MQRGFEAYSPLTGEFFSSTFEVETASAEGRPQDWPPFEQVNVQAGVDAWLAQDGRRHEIVGVTGYGARSSR